MLASRHSELSESELTSEASKSHHPYPSPRHNEMHSRAAGQSRLEALPIKADPVLLLRHWHTGRLPKIQLPPGKHADMAHAVNNFVVEPRSTA